MKTTIQDLLKHKFPMDETEQAILLDEINNIEKELREEYARLLPKIESYLTSRPQDENHASRNLFLGRFQKIREILGETL